MRPGVLPVGGGKFHARIEPVGCLTRLDLPERKAIRQRLARALLSKLSSQVGDRELAIVREQLGWSAEECRDESILDPVGPDSALLLKIEAEHLSGVVSSSGERGGQSYLPCNNQQPDLCRVRRWSCDHPLP